MGTYKLKPTGSQKSFYGKAVIIIEDGTAKLRSYSTIVATYKLDTKELKINGWYSATTARHINSFLNYYGFQAMSKKEMIEKSQEQSK